MYAILGGCIVSPSVEIKKKLRWIVDRGRDFPMDITKQIESWNTGVCFRDDQSRLTTRGWNFYGENEFREFKYLSKKKRIDVEDWRNEFGSEEVDHLACVHLVCSDERASSIIDEMRSYAKCEDRVYVWEPIPDLCDAQHFDGIKAVMNRHEKVILSPNAEEGARLFGISEPTTLEECENLAKRFDSFMGPENICVLRCGKLGSVALTARRKESRDLIHFPAYHFETPQKVIDPTGGGNTFLGGFSVGYVLTRGNVSIASICGNISAGCAIEQIGVPKLNHEKWNGLSFEERLGIYIETYKLPYDRETINKMLLDY